MDTSQLMTKLAEVAPDFMEYMQKTANELRQSPFRNETFYQLDTLIKKASFMSGVGNAAAGIGATALTGIAYSLAGDMYDALRRGVTKGKNYRKMLSANPDLAELNAKDVQKAYAALHRFNPEFAADPTVAGAFVRRQANLEEFDPTMLSNLVSARKNLTDVKRLPIPNRAPWESMDEQNERKLRVDKSKYEADPKTRGLQEALTSSTIAKNKADVLRNKPHP
jgi:hypothetical protein